MDDTTPPPQTPSILSRLSFALPCLVFIASAVMCLNETMLYSPDSVNYMGWAHSLSRLEGFRTSMGPEPERYVFNAPLYPVLLAPAALAFPLSIPAAKIITLLSGVFTLAAFQVFLSRRLPKGAALGAGLFLAVNPLFILYSTQVLSDIPFAACSVIILSMIERVVLPEDCPTRDAILFVAALCSALFLREVGIALVFAAGLLLLLRRRTRPLLILLIALTLTYGLWFVRNELIVARAENPGLRNLSLFFSHVYTESGASPLTEAASRLVRSVRFYGPALMSLVTAPFDVAWTYSVTDSTERIYSSAVTIVHALRWVLALVTLIPVALGARRIAREPVLGPFLAALIPAYAAIIAMYPVSDIRFLFPALLLLLWCAAAGLAEFAGHLEHGRMAWAGRSGSRIIIPILVLLALPNLAWIRNVASTNIAFRMNPEEFVAAHARTDPYPEELMLIPRRAAEWISGHSARETVVGSKIKAAALWLDGRPLLVLNPLLPMEEFDNRIRDYGITYLVCELQAHQIPDFALQMALSARHTFSPVFAFGDVRVYRVGEKSDPHQASLVPPGGGYGNAEDVFLQGVYALAYGGEKQAVATFEALEALPGAQTSALFYAAIAREFTMDLDAADSLFARFRTIPQSAAYLRQAQVHETIIGTLRSAGGDPPGEEKASKYRDAAMSYWILGFRTHAVTMLREALRLDPGSYAGEVLGAVFSLAGGDTAGARHGVRLAGRARPTDPMTRSLMSIISCIDSLPHAGAPGKLEIAIGREYAALGLYEMAVDQALKGLRDGDDREALRLLADMYIRKERRAPALSALRRLQNMSQGDPAVSEEIRKLALVWE
jgi:tetratricopeptide (TPR) repeat protein/4-amino-4-deoxy-L-arabinose transferase-like glycosyltransferase